LSVVAITDKYLFKFYGFSLDRSYTHENATVIGWGRLSENGPILPVLRHLAVPIYSDSACKSSKYGTKAITENMMCAGYDNGKLDACQVSYYLLSFR